MKGMQMCFCFSYNYKESYLGSYFRVMKCKCGLYIGHDKHPHHITSHHIIFSLGYESRMFKNQT